jgi:acetyl esterase/lipase
MVHNCDDRAVASRGLTAHVEFTTSATAFETAAVAAARHGEFIVVPGTGVRLTVPDSGIIRVDLGMPPADHSPGVRAHIRGRGLDGLRYAVDSWYHHRLHPATIVAYGEHPEQCAALRIPPGPGPFPVAALLHGGYWRARWGFDLMDALAVDLARRGYLSWNIEYRRPDEYRWAATTLDVFTAVQALIGKPEADPARVVLLGHSAGAQLVF